MMLFQAIRAIYGTDLDMAGGLYHCVVEELPPKGEEPEERLLGYEVTAGLSIFYVTTELFEEALRAGVAVPAPEPLPATNFEELRSGSGLIVFELLPDAMRRTTVEMLAATLERVNSRPSTVQIRVYDAFHQRYMERHHGAPQGPYPMELVRLDMKERKVLALEVPPQAVCVEQCYFPMFRREMDYAQCLEELAYRVYRKNQNVEDLYETYKEYDFYDVDRFFQRLLRLEFTFEPG